MSHEFLQTLLRKLPKIDALLRLPGMDLVCESHGRERVTEALRAAVEDLRRDLSEGRPGPRSLESWMEELPGCLARILQEELQTSLVPVINAAGVLLHTNLGRAPLSAAALSRVRDLSGVYTTLEYDLASGRRGSRSVHAQRILSRLFPGCAAHVVNNNAAAVLLAINGLAEGREVVVSRGELIEIG
ncbi:MAG TPA: L-seryl-tRNA(Sec) selenium transferase, partial [Candidatus Polarisedimenticolia bacterium]|nr:L-seryl-tRNA(Sec) selenium transferase [Candidatus Polarisedimenticolia bacterium]